jgi:hypothetical protein
MIKSWSSCRYLLGFRATVSYSIRVRARVCARCRDRGRSRAKV